MKSYRPTIEQLEERATPDAKWSQPVDVFQASPTTITAPSALTAIVDGSRIQETWTDNSSNETGFLVLQSANGGRTWKQLTTTGMNVTGCFATNLRPGKDYMYVVFAYNDTDISLHTNFAEVTFPRTK